MRAVATFALSLFTALGAAGGAWGCSFTLNEDLEFAVRDQMASLPIDVAADCSMTNIDVYDYLALGPAVDLGNGRVLQTWNQQTEYTQGEVFHHHAGRHFVTDCNAALVTYLGGPVLYDTSCGPERSEVVGPNGPLTFREGESLADLEALVVAGGGVVADPYGINVYHYGLPVLSTEVVSFTCGCRLFYPDSPGARQ